MKGRQFHADAWYFNLTAVSTAFTMNPFETQLLLTSLRY